MKSLYSIHSTAHAAFTLAEMMVAVATGSLLTAAVVALGLYTARSFNMIGNYVDLDAQSRYAADVLGREIRDASALQAFSTNNPSFLRLFNATTGQTITITYDTNSATLMFAKSGQPTQTLLTHCNSWTFSLYNRYPNTNSITFYGATNSAGNLDVKVCKVINMSWKCSRTVLGSPFNTESVQTAQIVLRNKITD